MTPGHVFQCGGGQFNGRYVPLIDILRDDGAVVSEDGTLIRASTNCIVGSEGDRFVHVAGLTTNGDTRLLRFGTRMRGRGGLRDISIAERAAEMGWALREDGLLQPNDGGPPRPFDWPFLQNGFNPEDYILSRSGVTLAQIYANGAWESVGPQLPVPAWDAMAAPAPQQPRQQDVNDPSRGGTTRPSSLDQFNAAFEPMAPPAPKPTRKQRRAMEARRRKGDRGTQASLAIH